MRGEAVLVNRALMRHQLLFGVEKKLLVIYGAGICFLLLICLSRAHSLIWLPILIFIICHSIALRMAKADPQMMECFLRYVRFSQGYYPANSTHFSNIKPSKPSIPKIKKLTD